ncbi:MAG: peptidyl-alpha-hydroxyglycine alpha-amidating lyase family protein [Gemmatimonadota bacterium]|nr:peptidyl-alpha-hydroxyglycine alpha-amidating lyase family protein [Gemmatimonadota bacterium]
MRRSIRICVLTGIALGGALLMPIDGAGSQLQDQTQVVPTNDLPNPYARMEPWGAVPTGPYAQRTAFIGAEEGPDGNIYLLNRCVANSCAGRPESPVLKFDPSGRLLGSWGAGMFSFPHGFATDAEGNVWASDQRGHQVFKWSPNGRLLMTIGERGEGGDPPQRLNEPTDVAIAPNGDIFITEGHSFAAGVNRVSKFRADGTFLMSFGTTGSGPGQFNVPHTVALDSRGRVFVGDRGNNRIQLFDQEGRFLEVWYQFGRPSGIAITPDDRIYVADSESYGTDNPGWKKGIRVGSARDGSVEYLIEDIESTAMEHSGAEGVGVDARGNVYGAVVRRRMLERHEPVADPNRGVANAEAAAVNAHVGHTATSFGQTPGSRGLVATATTDAGTGVLHANFAAGDLSDLGSMQGHAAHVLHTLMPEPGVSGPGTGYGLLRTLGEIGLHVDLAARVPEASASLRTHVQHIRAITRSVARRTAAAAAVARDLQEATSIRVAAPLVARLRLLMYQIAEGGDQDGSGDLSLEAEAGLQQLEAHVYLMLEGEGLPRIIQ